MIKLFDYPVPAIGTKGIYSLLPPFTTEPGEVLECIAVRTLSSYIANNDDPLNEVYKSNQLATKLTDEDYAADLDVDMQIVTLVNDKGYRILVPAKYLASYPVQDGVLYRALSIGVALPLMPVSQNLDFLLEDIATLIKAKIGVNSKTSLIEATEPRAYTQDQHAVVQASRNMVISGDATLYGTVAKQQRLIDELVSRNTALENYIMEKLPPT